MGRIAKVNAVHLDKWRSQEFVQKKNSDQNKILIKNDSWGVLFNEPNPELEYPDGISLIFTE